MPVFMRNAWKHNLSVAPTLVYDLAIMDDRSVLEERRAAISIPTLVLGGEKSPQSLRDAVTRVAAALPNAKARLLEGQAHGVSAPAVAPLVAEFLRTNWL